MPHLRAQLQAALQGSYTLERELGGGGMSRVFVADEVRLGRKVVVKVLSPDLAAGLSAERFEREIKLAASLQQANIVPVLAAGDIGGLPFYTMPFVEGESLRTRLAAGGVPAVGEVVSILRDVARALQFAHQRGIAHRDIKPDNVLLSGGTAVVTDFGIAKAVAAAKRSDESGGNGEKHLASAALTAMGTSLGTPAYMSPEQAAGDPDVDHRSDIYAFGCMAYELLAGRTPFHGRTPQRVLAAHMAEDPPNVSESRPDAPAALCDLVMRCLAKNPAERPQSATEIVTVLEAAASSSADSAMPTILLGGRAAFRKALLVYAGAFIVVAVVARAAIVGIGLPEWVFPGALIAMALGLPAILFTAYAQRVAHRIAIATPTYTPGGTPSVVAQGTMATIAAKASPHLSWRRTTVAVFTAVGVFVAIVGGFMLLRALGVGPAASLFAAGKLDRRAPLVLAEFRTSRVDTSIGTVVTEAVRANLSQSKSIAIVAPTAVATTMRFMQLPPTTRVDAEIARRVAARQRAHGVIDGEITALGTGFVVTIRLTSTDSGLVLASYQTTVDSPKELIASVDGLTRKLRGKIGESFRAVHGSLPLEKVTTASLEALRLYSEGVRAHDLDANYSRAISLLRRAVAVDSNFAMAWRKLGVALRNSGASYAASDSALARAFELRSRLTDEERYATEAYYYYSGPGLDRRKAIAAYQALLDHGDSSSGTINNLAVAYGSLRQFARAESLYTFVVRKDSMFLLPQTNLVETFVNNRKPAEAVALLDQLRHRLPKNGLVMRRVLNVTYVRGDVGGAQRLADSLQKAGDPQLRPYATYFLSRLDLLHGRITAAERRLVDTLRQRSAITSMNDSLLVSIDDAWYRGRPDRALKRLDAILASPMLASLPASNTIYMRLAGAYAFAGQPARARTLLAQHTAAIGDSLAMRRMATETHGLRAMVALADKNSREAMVEIRRVDSLPDGPVSSNPLGALMYLAQAFDLAGQTDSAVMTFEKYISTPYYSRIDSDAMYLAGSYKRLGELYEAKGDRQKAASYYTKFIELWKDADPDLQPRVTEVRRRLAAIAAERSQ